MEQKFGALAGFRIAAIIAAVASPFLWWVSRSQPDAWMVVVLPVALLVVLGLKWPTMIVVDGNGVRQKSLFGTSLYIPFSDVLSVSRSSDGQASAIIVLGTEAVITHTGWHERQNDFVKLMQQSIESKTHALTAEEHEAVLRRHGG